MVTTAVRAATMIQIGKEGTRGTYVPATRKLLLDAAQYRKLEELEPHEQQMHGTLARTAKPPTITRQGTEFDIQTALDFEQILVPLLSGVKGGVTPSTPGSGEARLWTFTPAVSADPLPDTYSIEYVTRNLDAAPTEDMWGCQYGFTTQLEISGGVEALPQMSWAMVGRKSLAPGRTGGQALPALHWAPNLGWKLFRDTAWAGLGNSQISGQVYAFTFALSDFLFPQYYLDGQSGLDFSQYQFRPRTVDLVLEVVYDPRAAGGMVREKGVAKTAGTPRFIRLEIKGEAFAAPDAALNYMIQLDGAFLHLSDSMTEFGQDRDGNPTARMHLQSYYDPTGTQDFQIAVQNKLTAFP